MTHICVGNLTIIGSDNGLSPERRQAIIWSNAGLLLIRPWATNFSEILIGIHTFSFKKTHLKMSSAKWRPFYFGLNVLSAVHFLHGLAVNLFMYQTLEIMDWFQVDINPRHDDVIKWNHFPRYWPFVRGNHRSRWIPRTQRPVTRSFDVFFDLRLNKRLNKQQWDWWFETPPWSLWRQCNEFSIRALYVTENLWLVSI